MSDVRTIQKTLTISRRAIQLIIDFEVGSPSSYQRRYSHPTFPGGDSGVTIGIGYDLGYNSKDRIRKDWEGYVNGNELVLLMAASGLKKEMAKKAINDRMRKVTVTYEAAYSVFVNSTLPRFAKQALSIYPGLDHLFPDASGAIVSMVFNRGNSLVDADHDELHRRQEMRAIVPLVAVKDYEGIAEQIEHSKRLWGGQGLDGLVKRRIDEANLIRQSIRQYSQDELVTIQV